ncbi:uncharacterized protein LOC121976369 isoform X2 [Zingiber officinale]|uniref:uncharacterized protein LOC121976369 isoform X2 n=1 Tax=Zingiber officinale TaxID=94328 RepID=UPI001C4BF624|nr:uncharacterized protein LOC121976369 isoform X2 [Zingiber officinale]
MVRKPSSSCCAICEGSNLASICAPCVNHKLNEYSPLLKSLNTVCKSHYSKLDDLLAKKRKADQQINWRVMQNVELKALKERLTYLKKKLAEGLFLCR